MTKIGILSDTHGYLDQRVFEHFKDVDEFWHAGDIGSMEVLQALREFKPTRAVYGNMDSGDVRYSLEEFYRFRVEEVNVLLGHIIGHPGRYNPILRNIFEGTRLFPDDPKMRIDLVVCGHSHILKVQYDPYYKFLTMNPGAAGKQGWQPCQTLLRFTIDGSKIDNLEVIELERL